LQLRRSLDVSISQENEILNN